LDLNHPDHPAPLLSEKGEGNVEEIGKIGGEGRKENQHPQTKVRPFPGPQGSVDKEQNKDQTEKSIQKNKAEDPRGDPLKILFEQSQTNPVPVGNEIEDKVGEKGERNSKPRFGQKTGDRHPRRGVGRKKHRGYYRMINGE